MLAVVATSVAGSLLAPGAAGATPSLTVSPTSTIFVTPSSSTTLSGLSISGDSTDQLQTTVATNLGTLSISTTTGLTLAYNNSWTGTQSITFTGLESAVNAALATTTLTTSATTGTAQISLTAMVAQSGYNYLASNQHFYEYVQCAGCSWTTADAGAQALSLDGQPGYLATIPNSTVNTFISTKIANATNVWFGARSYESLATDGSQAYAVQGGVTYARVWRWVEGANESPIAGGVISECTNQLSTCSFTNSGSFYSSWASGEPNNSGGSATVAYQGEYVAVTNWSGTSGSWNDLSPTNDVSVSGYVVEFGGKTNSNASLGTGFAGVVTTSSNVLVAAAATAPGAPTITATPGDSSAALSWNPPASNGASITSYQVSTDGGSTWSTISTSSSNSIVNGNTVTTVSATVTPLTNGTTYQIEVRAVNSVGPGAGSNTASVTPAAVPGAPTGVSATAGNSSAAVSWSAPASNGSAITSYTVTSSPGGQSCVWTSGPLTCTVNGISNGTPYTFSVTATNGVGTGPASSASTAVTPAAVPGAPTGVSATAGDGVASVSFTAPVSDGGSAITGYTVTAYPGGATTSCSISPCTVTGLTDGTPYTFLVSAINAVGTGPSSTPSTAVTPAGLPGAPTEVSAKAGDGAATVSWTAPVSNGSQITSYVVTTAPGGATTSCSASPCTINGLNDGTVYTFTVTAINGVGTGPASSASNAVTPALAELGIALSVTPHGTPQDRTFVVSGSGLEPGSTVTIVLHSSPVTLATVTVGLDGSFSATVTLPTDLAAGTHTIIATGTSPFGLPVTSSAQFVQDAPDPPAPALPTTGFNAGTGTALGVFALLTGLGLIRLGRRRARRA
ncbi:MAG: fibronectin type III domain-containing protein [Acidimicrobiales bacterium]